MKNPLRSEAEAFQFLIAVIIGALVIGGAAYLNTWLGVAAAVVAIAGIVWWLRQEPLPGVPDPPRKLESGTLRGTHRVLVLALPGAASARVPERATDIIVVVPAVASTVESLTGAVDDRRAAAEETANRLAAQLVNARAEVGADDPALAIEDALRTFGADEIVVVGDEALAATIRARVTLPVSLA